MTESHENEIVEPGNVDEVDPLDNIYQEIEEDRLPEAREVIIPLFMKAGKEDVQLGDAIYDAETSSMVVKFNTPAGRDISNLIGSGVLVGITFGGQMARNKITNKLN